jgi:SanA protein
MTTNDAAPHQRHRPWWRRFEWLAVGASVGLVSATLSANAWIRHQARPFLYTDLSQVAAPIAIVPGASVRRDGTPSHQLEDRLATALALLRARRVDRILVSGARNGAYDEAGPMRRWLIQRGAHPSMVLDDHAGFRTLDTMERAARAYSINRAVVCTQSYHLPRAVFLARRAGIDAVGLSVDTGTSGGSVENSLRESLAGLMAVVDSYVLPILASLRITEADRSSLAQSPQPHEWHRRRPSMSPVPPGSGRLSLRFDPANRNANADRAGVASARGFQALQYRSLGPTLPAEQRGGDPR